MPINMSSFGVQAGLRWYIVRQKVHPVAFRFARGKKDLQHGTYKIRPASVSAPGKHAIEGSTSCSSCRCHRDEDARKMRRRRCRTTKLPSTALSSMTMGPPRAIELDDTEKSCVVHGYLHQAFRPCAAPISVRTRNQPIEPIYLACSSLRAAVCEPLAMC